MILLLVLITKFSRNQNQMKDDTLKVLLGTKGVISVEFDCSDDDSITCTIMTKESFFVGKKASSDDALNEAYDMFVATSNHNKANPFHYSLNMELPALNVKRKSVS